MRIGLLVYASENEGRLPRTLWTLIPRYAEQEGFTSHRYRDVKTGERFDWLYFPREKLDGLAPDTILLAAPGSFLRSPGKPSRLIWTPLGDVREVPEADFQRLIREQNPPPAQ